MSGSASPRGEYRKITAASTNMHITGREKTRAAQPDQEVLVAAAAVSDGEWEVSGTDVLSRAVPELVYPACTGRAGPQRLYGNLCRPYGTRFYLPLYPALKLDYSSGSHVLKGHGFSRAVMRVENWALAPEGSRISPQHRSPSVAKANHK